MNLVLYAMINFDLAYGHLPPPGDVMERMTGAKNVPHHALIVYSNLYCSGSLMTRKVVVTAASCLLNYRKGNKVIVKVGSDTVTDNGQIIRVKKVKIHEYFRHLSSLDNDIAMLILETQVKLNKRVGIVNIIQPDRSLHDGTPLFVVGWAGNDLPTKYANTILLYEMTVISKLDCEKIHGPLITQSNFCARYTYQQLVNDNGGGALYNDRLVGVLSYGATDTKAPSVAIFTNVSYFHRWLNLNTIELVSRHYHRRNLTYNNSHK